MTLARRAANSSGGKISSPRNARRAPGAPEAAARRPVASSRGTRLMMETRTAAIIRQLVLEADQRAHQFGARLQNGRGARILHERIERTVAEVQAARREQADAGPPFVQRRTRA